MHFVFVPDCVRGGGQPVRALAVSFTKSLLNAVLVFMSYSLIMSIIWILLESPDLAITEAAVGAGITTVLFVLTLKKIHAIMGAEAAGREAESELEHRRTRSL